jgi:hypothetical protein
MMIGRMSRKGRRFLKCNIGCFLDFVNGRRSFHVIQYYIEFGVNFFGGQLEGSNPTVELSSDFSLVGYFNPNHFKVIINGISRWYRDGWTRLGNRG